MTTPRPNGEAPWLAETQLGRKLLAEEEKKSLAERQALVKEIERIQTEAATQRPGLVERFDQAVDRVAELETELQAAKGERFQAKNAIWDHDHQLGQALIPLRKQLANVAPPEIDRFVSELETIVKQTQGETIPITQTRKRSFWGLRTITLKSALGSMSRRVLACRNAQQEAEVLRLSALDEEALSERLATLRATIPMKTEMEEIVS